jgi:hypothetical protein
MYQRAAKCPHDGGDYLQTSGANKEASALNARSRIVTVVKSDIEL